jgi:hypothetical protein
VIVAVGPNVRPFDDEPKLIDMAPTILAALQAPASMWCHQRSHRSSTRRGVTAS